MNRREFNLLAGMALGAPKAMAAAVRFDSVAKTWLISNPSSSANWHSIRPAA